MKFLLFLLLALSIGTHLFAQTSYYIKARELNLRDAPTTTGSTVLGTFTTNQQVTVYDYSGDWARVKVDNRVGYMKAEFLSSSQTNNSYNTNSNYNNSSTNSRNSYNNSTNNSRSQSSPGQSRTDYNSGSVMVCNSAKAYSYHSGYCGGLSRCTHGVSTVSVGEAQRMGRQPCQKCY